MSNRRTADADAAIAELKRRNPELRIKDDGNGSRPAAYRLTEAQPHAARQQQAPTEHEEQCALFRWAEAQEAQRPELAMLAAIPNGGYRPMTTAAALKAEGVKAGYPDILLDVARGHWHGLRIELKRADRSNRTTEAQDEWIARLRSYGAYEAA